METWSDPPLACRIPASFRSIIFVVPTFLWHCFILNLLLPLLMKCTQFWSSSTVSFLKRTIATLPTQMVFLPSRLSYFSLLQRCPALPQFQPPNHVKAKLAAQTQKESTWTEERNLSLLCPALGLCLPWNTDLVEWNLGRNNQVSSSWTLSPSHHFLKAPSVTVLVLSTFPCITSSQQAIKVCLYFNWWKERTSNLPRYLS